MVAEAEQEYAKQASQRKFLNDIIINDHLNFELLGLIFPSLREEEIVESREILEHWASEPELCYTQLH